MTRNIKAAVVLHLKDGEWELRVFGDDAGEVMVLTVDDSCPRDRVFEHTRREPNEALREIVGDSPIGHMGDGLISDNQEQAVRAMFWRGRNRLGVLPGGVETAPADHPASDSQSADASRAPGLTKNLSESTPT